LPFHDDDGDSVARVRHRQEQNDATMPSSLRGLVLACAGDDGSARDAMRDVLPAADEEVLDAVATRSMGPAEEELPGGTSV
jgi:hypothetical protein